MEFGNISSASLLPFRFYFTVFISLYFRFIKSFQGLGTHVLGFFCVLFLRSCCYKILSLILLVSRSEISSNSTPSSVGLGDAPLTFAFSLLCCRNLQSSKSNLSLTVHWFTLNLTAVTLLKFSEIVSKFFLFHCFLSWTCKTLVPKFLCTTTRRALLSIKLACCKNQNYQKWMNFLITCYQHPPA